MRPMSPVKVMVQLWAARNAAAERQPDGPLSNGIIKGSSLAPKRASVPHADS
jgi:hypothetical protein